MLKRPLAHSPDTQEGMCHDDAGSLSSDSALPPPQALSLHDERVLIPG